MNNKHWREAFWKALKMRLWVKQNQASGGHRYLTVQEDRLVGC